MGKLNLLKSIADELVATIPEMEFIQPGYDFWVGTVHAHYEETNLGSGLEGFRNWIDRLRFIVGEIRAGRTPVAYMLGLPAHLVAGFPFFEKVGDFLEKLIEIWS